MLSSDVVVLLTVVSLLTFVTSAVALPWLLSRLPADYLVRPNALPSPRWPRGFVAYWAVRLLRNLAGLTLVLAGILMLVTPGQGLLTLLAGLWLMDIPGKTQLERSLARRSQILSSINWIRGKAGAPPLIAPHRKSEADEE